MYKEHFGFTAAPFSIAPDPHSLYMSERHKEALAHLFYGMSSDGGFVMLTGEVGTGKTTICRCLLQQVPEDTDIAFIFNPKLTVKELLATICDEFSIHHPANQNSIKFYVDHLNSYLLHSHANGRKAVLIIDEAQNLSTDVLEQIRLLTNLETNKRKLLQIILLGQPELKKMLQQPELRQLGQRITARYHLTPLAENEVGFYVAHRLAIAGGRNRIFPESTMKTLFKLSNGTPRLINIICDRSLLGAYVQDQDKVNIKTIKKAAREVFGGIVDRPPPTIKKSAMLLAGLLLLLGGSLLAAAYLNQIPAAFFAMLNPGEQGAILAPPLGPSAQRASEALTPPEQLLEAPPTDLMAPVQPPGIETEGAGDEKIAALKGKAHSLPLSSQELSAGEPLATSLVMAYQALFDCWAIADVPVDIASAYAIAEAHNLRHLNRQGSFESLLALNRPAVLSLVDMHGERLYAALIAFDGQSAEVVIGSERTHIAIEDFMARWNGEYSLLWAKPEGYFAAIEPENHGAHVAWLDKKLAIIQGRPASSKAPVLYDDALVSQIKQFQRDRNLVADGIVDERTIIHLNSAYNSRVPKLIAMAEDN